MPTLLDSDWDTLNLQPAPPSDASLAREFRYCLRSGGWHCGLETMRHLGVTAQAIGAAGISIGCPWWPLGACRIECTASEMWAPRDDGQMAMVMPAMEGGAVIDMVAWFPDKPQRLYCRRGDAWCIGADACSRARWDAGCQIDPAPPPLPVHDHAHDWLLSGGEGTLLVDWRRAGAHLIDLPSLVAASRRIGERLDALFMRRAPKIFFEEAA